MAITRRTDYAVRLMSELAQVPTGATLSVRDLCEVADVPANFGASIVAYLAEAGLVRTESYNNHLLSLARSAEEITVAEIVRASEPGFSLSPCVNDPASCCRSDQCRAHLLWSELDAVIWQHLETTALAQIAPGTSVQRKAPTVIAPSVAGFAGIF